MNNNYSVIILIIASDHIDNYVKMQQIWKLYMNTHPHIKSFFIKENNQLTVPLLVDEDNDTIYVKCEASLAPGVLIKTIKSFEYIYENYNFKYIYRTNLSSFLDLHKLYTFSQSHSFQYGGIIGTHTNIKFASGSGFFVSKDCVNYLINNKNIDYYTYLDDVELGKTLSQVYQITFVNRTGFTDFDTKQIKDSDIIESSTFHFRCKNEMDWSKTVYNLQKMYELIYL